MSIQDESAPGATRAVATARRLLRPAAGAAAAWAAQRFFGRAADDGYDIVRDKVGQDVEDRQQQALAEQLCRARGWRYQPFVVDHASRYVVFDGDKHPMAAFPPVLDASTPETLAVRFELAGYVPNDDELVAPATDDLPAGDAA